MAYQVIARKYRPQRFADVVGQEHVTQTLANAIAQNRIAHAYLFCGPRGTGKTTVARIFAKCLNCTGGPKVDFDDADPRCVEITEGRSIDVLEIDGASNNGVEQVRELRETCKYAPASSKFKIYIIDEVHMLSAAAFNALLKTLEEPPAHVKFMFATTEPEKVLPTILSRCQRFDLRRIPSVLIVEHLVKIAQAETVKIDDAALHAIARGADGGMRDAESALDQLISFCGDRIVEEDVLSMFGLVARDQILALATAVLEGKMESALRQLNELAQSGKDLGRLLSELLNHFRNLLIYQVSGGDRGLLEVSEGEAETLGQQAPTIASEALTRMMEVLVNGEVQLRDAASKKIFLEVLLLKAIQARNAVSLDTVLKRLQQLRREAEGSPAESAAVSPPMASNVLAPVNLAAPAETALRVATPTRPKAPLPAVASATAAASNPAPTPAVPASASTESDPLEALWSRVLEAVGRVSPFARTYLLEAFPMSVTKNVLTVGFDPEFADHLTLVDNTKNRTLIQTKLQELGYGELHVKFVQAEAPPNRVRPTVQVRESNGASAAPASEREAGSPRGKAKPAPATMDDFKNDPLIQQALEIFKGQIVEVRA